MPYQPRPVVLSPGASPGVEELQEYVKLELEKIAQNLIDSDYFKLKQTNIAVTKPRNGMVVYADGTNWNPGSGEGFYGYYAGSWKKLG